MSSGKRVEKQNINTGVLALRMVTEATVAMKPPWEALLVISCYITKDAKTLQLKVLIILKFPHLTGLRWVPLAQGQEL